MSQAAAPLPPAGGRVKELFRKYGKVAIGVHLAVYATFFAGESAGGAADSVTTGNLLPPVLPRLACSPDPLCSISPAGCYVAVDQKVDVRGLLSKVGLLSAKTYDETADVDPEHRSWVDKALTGGSSTIALAFLCNKALFPVRTPITLALTPTVAR